MTANRGTVWGKRNKDITLLWRLVKPCTQKVDRGTGYFRRGKVPGTVWDYDVMPTLYLFH